MNNKKYLIYLIFIILLIIALSFGLVRYYNKNQITIDKQAYILPNLPKDLAKITRIEIQDHDQTFQLGIDNGVWRFTSKHGYPISVTRLRQWLLNLSEAHKIDHVKTSLSPQITIKLLAETQPLYDIKFTLPTTKQDGPVSRLIYNQNQEVYFKNGFAINPIEWLDQDIMHILNEEVKALSITTKNKTFTIERKSKQSKFTSPHLSQSQEEEHQAELKQLASALEFLNFTDIKPFASPDKHLKLISSLHVTRFEAPPITLDLFQDNTQKELYFLHWRNPTEAHSFKKEWCYQISLSNAELMLKTADDFKSNKMQKQNKVAF